MLDLIEDPPDNIVYFDKCNQPRRYEWLNNKKQLHSKNDKPASISFYVLGPIRLKAWYKNNKLHRENDSPAIVVYNRNEEVTQLAWYINDQPQRENNLPTVEIYSDMKLIEQKWMKYKPDWFHRDHAPAIIIDNKEYWYLKNKLISDQVINFIKECNLPDWREWNENHKMLFRLRFDL